MAQRNTVQRALVLKTVQGMQGAHPTADEVFSYLKVAQPAISRATVYRNLAVLHENGVLNRLKVPQGADRYDTPATTHQHLHCIICGKVEDITLESFKNTLEEAQSKAGYRILNQETVFEGVCPACQIKKREGEKE